MDYISGDDEFSLSPVNDHKRVLVTGFGPFTSNGVDINVNASGEAVKLLNKYDLENRLNITLVTKEIPVEYKCIDEIVPCIWTQFQPHLTIHVGVSDITAGFTLEKKAARSKYIIPDNTAMCPHNAENPSRGPLNLATDLELTRICDEFNYGLPNDCFKADVSDDAGKYVCEYIYYTSLCQQLLEKRTSLFIHVPPMTYKQEFEVLARGLERILDISLAHIRMQDTIDNFNAYTKYDWYSNCRV